MNVWLREFYNDIKDESWQDINSYFEFTQLPSDIQQECVTQHGFYDRLLQIENQDYWRKHSFQGAYRKHNVVFIIMAKCASSSYESYLRQQMWEKITFEQIDFKNMYVFGFMLDPLTRRCKGITEVLCQSYNNDYKKISEKLYDRKFSTFLRYITVMDQHTIPYWLLFGEYLEKINWIPLEFYSKSETFDIFKQVCDKYNIKLDKNVKFANKNASNEDKNNIHKLVTQIFKKQKLGELYLLYSPDLKFYRKLVDIHLSKNNQ